MVSILFSTNTTKLGVTAEFAKLLVPTPPVYGDRIEYIDNNGNGQYDLPDNDPTTADDQFISTEENYIISGQDPNVDFVSGIFQSFGDAPGGAKEELTGVYLRFRF